MTGPTVPSEAAEAAKAAYTDAYVVDMCHNGHPFEPGIDIDMTNEGRKPDKRWCNVCGETRGWLVGPSGETARVAKRLAEQA